MYRTIIVDDEKAQQEVLGRMLSERFPDFYISDVCSSVDEALSCISVSKPELVFLDVILPPNTGFDLLNRLGKPAFEIIFTTSYEEYAIRALKVSAIDYLLKPFDVDELKIAIEKFKDRIVLKESLQHIETLLQNVNNNTSEKTKIALPTQTGYVFVAVGEIIRCEADDTYTTFFLTDQKKYIVSKTLKEYEELLSYYHFFRVHNSHLINMRCIKEYFKGEGGIVKMTDGTEISVSRRKKDQFLNALNKL